MSTVSRKRMKSVSLDDVKLESGFLADKNTLVREEVIPYQWKALNNEIPGAEPSNAIENFRIAAGESRGEFIGMVFQDSDVAKWLEAVSYKLNTNPEPELEELADSVIELIEKAQLPDGYLNTYFTIKEPENKWTNLAECHELYCAGHMIEAAVAYYKATGKRKLLDVMARFADHIDEKIGYDPEKLKGYPGHQEIELALIKLYSVTGNNRYKNLAAYFIDQRGKEPFYFDLEWEKRERRSHFPGFRDMSESREYFQAHKPVLEQKVAVGHAVRALYMYSGMADLAWESGDQELFKVCQQLWENVTTKQMYITGGVGSSGYSESFTIDYDLPNDTAYTETCAAIALVFFARRMFYLESSSKYIDIMEKALYNGILSAMSEDGTKFFYVNPLEVNPEVCKTRNDHKHIKTTRQKWFGCACCPPNIARLMASIGKYIYSYTDNEVFVNLYSASRGKIKIKNEEIVIKQSTDYPWDEEVKFVLSSKKDLKFTIALRIPGWCREAVIRVNGEEIDISEVIDKGYAYIKRNWSDGDKINLSLKMPVEKVYSNPQLRENTGKVALQRGPLVYCLEEVDNGKNLSAIYLPESSELKVRYRDDLLNGVSVIKGCAHRIDKEAFADELYSTARPEFNTFEITAIPYFAWGNRERGEMLVWLNERCVGHYE